MMYLREQRRIRFGVRLATSRTRAGYAVFRIRLPCPPSLLSRFDSVLLAAHLEVILSVNLTTGARPESRFRTYRGAARSRAMVP